MTIRIGNASAFWGDSRFGILRIASEVDYLTLDYLSEVSLSIMAVQKEKNPELGYAEDFLKAMQQIVPVFEKGKPLKVITNAGGLNPRALAQKVKALKPDLRVFVVLGDDVLQTMQQDPSSQHYQNLDTQASYETITSLAVTANAYLGAYPIKEALDLGADIVITGRSADPSLTLAPCLHHFKWKNEEWDKLAAGTIAGHLIECGTQVTGGISTDWLNLSKDPPIGFPIAEISEDASILITKQTGSGGAVTEMTVKEQLLYEIGDPSGYLSPDVTVSFLQLSVETVGQDRVAVRGAKGSPPTNTFKVSATYRAGFKAEGMLTLCGSDLKEKALAAGELLFNKLDLMGSKYEDRLTELIGKGEEAVLRLAVRSFQKKSVEAFSEEVASLVTCGPPGTTGYSSGRPKVRPAFGFWPCLIEKKTVNVTIEEVS